MLTYADVCRSSSLLNDDEARIMLSQGDTAATEAAARGGAPALPASVSPVVRWGTLYACILTYAYADV